LVDEIVEPVRSILIPFFHELKQIALEKGALGFGISGSGPSVYAMCRGEESAEKVKIGLQEFYQQKAIDFDLHLSKINTTGIKII
jgi:homoserine kinase